MKKFWNKAVEWVKPYATLKMIPCLALAWLITNGWAYVFIVVGPALGIKWMTIAGSTWAAILWMPFTPEKPLLTIPLSLLFYRVFYREKFKSKEKENKALEE